MADGGPRSAPLPPFPAQNSPVVPSNRHDGNGMPVGLLATTLSRPPLPSASRFPMTGYRPHSLSPAAYSSIGMDMQSVVHRYVHLLTGPRLHIAGSRGFDSIPYPYNSPRSRRPLRDSPSYMVHSWQPWLALPHRSSASSRPPVQQPRSARIGFILPIPRILPNSPSAFAPLARRVPDYTPRRCSVFEGRTRQSKAEPPKEAPTTSHHGSLLLDRPCQHHTRPLI
ncbi:hypothetical protein B0T14DRAFT_120114 [Immersiella caudata]|uniref:Uncharacterized protein n=1 Tax=Immersiella caudata TaxID=314043 RepID=A0AA39X3W8_9PEZI|nr:hypothetical protein B0T14DRAFT_120114 [Immersiella caudata]